MPEAQLVFQIIADPKSFVQGTRSAQTSASQLEAALSRLSGGALKFGESAKQLAQIQSILSAETKKQASSRQILNAIGAQSVQQIRDEITVLDQLAASIDSKEAPAIRRVNQLREERIRLLGQEASQSSTLDQAVRRVSQGQLTLAESSQRAANLEQILATSTRERANAQKIANALGTKTVDQLQDEIRVLDRLADLSQGQEPTLRRINELRQERLRLLGQEEKVFNKVDRAINILRQSEEGLADTEQIINALGVQSRAQIENRITALRELATAIPETEALAHTRINAELEQLQLGLQGVPQTARQAEQAMFSLGFVVQDSAQFFRGGSIDFSNGIRAIANNIQPLIQQVHAMEGGFSALAKQLYGAGGLILGINLLTTLIVLFGERARDAKKETDDWADALDDASSKLLNLQQIRGTADELTEFQGSEVLRQVNEQIAAFEQLEARFKSLRTERAQLLRPSTREGFFSQEQIERLKETEKGYEAIRGEYERFLPHIENLRRAQEELSEQFDQDRAFNEMTSTFRAFGISIPNKELGEVVANIEELQQEQNRLKSLQDEGIVNLIEWRNQLREQNKELRIQLGLEDDNQKKTKERISLLQRLREEQKELTLTLAELTGSRRDEIGTLIASNARLERRKQILMDILRIEKGILQEAEIKPSVGLFDSFTGEFDPSLAAPSPEEARRRRQEVQQRIADRARERKLIIETRASLRTLSDASIQTANEMQIAFNEASRNIEVDMVTVLLRTEEGFKALEQIAHGVFGGLSKVFRTAFQAGNRENQAFFKAFKAFAIFEAIISTYVAANRALASAPPPFNFIAMGTVIAAGLANVAKIAATGPGGGRGGRGGGGGATRLFVTAPSRAARIAGPRSDRQSGGRGFPITSVRQTIDVNITGQLVSRRGAVVGMIQDAGIFTSRARSVT